MVKTFPFQRSRMHGRSPALTRLLAVFAVVLPAAAIVALGYGIWLVAGLCFGGVAYACLRRSDLGLFTYLIGSNVVAEVSRRIGESFPIGLALDALVLITLAGAAIRYVINRRYRLILRTNPAYFLTLVLILYACLMVFSPYLGRAPLEMKLQGLRLLVLPPLFLFVALEHLGRPKVYKAFFVLVLLLGLMQSFIGFVQRQMGEEALVALYSSYNSSYSEAIARRSWGGEIRAFGWLNEPYVAAAAVGLAAIFCLALTYQARLSRKWAVYLALAVLVTMLVFTFTRMAWIAFAVVAVMMLLRPRRTYVLISAATAVLGFFATASWLLSVFAAQLSRSPYLARLIQMIRDPMSDISVSLRLLGIRYAWDTALDTFFGLGPGTTHAIAAKYGYMWKGWVPAPDNQYGQYLVELGFPGFLLVLLIAFLGLRAGWRVWRASQPGNGSRDQTLLAAASLGCLAFLLIMNFSGMYMTTPPVSYYLWYILGVLFALEQGIGRERADGRIAPVE